MDWKAHNVVLSDINRLLFSCVKVISKFPGIHCRRNKKHLETRHQFLVNQNHNLLVCKVVISLDINIKMKIMLPVMWNFILLILIKLIKIIRLVVLNEADFISSLNLQWVKNVSEYSKIFHRRTFKEYYILEQKLSVIVCVIFCSD